MPHSCWSSGYLLPLLTITFSPLNDTLFSSWLFLQVNFIIVVNVLRQLLPCEVVEEIVNNLVGDGCPSPLDEIYLPHLSGSYVF
jgi:hypothetical protein